MKKGFDNDLYLKVQSKKIKERLKKFDNKLSCNESTTWFSRRF